MKDKRLPIGFRYAIAGIIYAIKNERNFRIHLLATVVVIMFSLICHLELFEWIAIIFVIGFVLVSELFNTAVELIIDYIKPEIHPVAKAIKDLAAGAVLITSIVAVIIGLIIFLPYIINLFL